MNQPIGRFAHLDEDELIHLLRDLDEEIDNLQHYVGRNKTLKPAEIEAIRKQLINMQLEFGEAHYELRDREIDGFEWYDEDEGNL